MKSTAIVLAVLLVFPLTARAADADEGFELALRTGYALPFGKMDGSAARNISDAIGGVIPAWIEAGYRFSPNFFGGAFFQWGYGLTKNCPAGASCSASHVRVGIEALFHLLPESVANPWLGMGFGYEWINLSASDSTGSADGQGRGFEFLSVQGGLDFGIGPRMRLGPFVTFTVSQVGTETISSGGRSISADVTNKSIHDFLLFGIRLSFDAS